MLIRPNARLVVLNNPTSPTGSFLSWDELKGAAGLPKSHGILLICSEVVRFLHHTKEIEVPPSLLHLGYEWTIVTGNVSKGSALPVIHVRWLAIHPPLRQLIGCLIPHLQNHGHRCESSRPADHCFRSEVEGTRAGFR